MELSYVILIVMMAVIVEGIITWFDVFRDSGYQPKLVASIVIGEIVAIYFGLDMVGFLGFEPAFVFKYDWVIGAVLTGLLIARGSNWVFEFIGKITKIRTDSDAIQGTLNTTTEPKIYLTESELNDIKSQANIMRHLAKTESGENIYEVKK